jgi:hypothetical protein
MDIETLKQLAKAGTWSDIYRVPERFLGVAPPPQRAPDVPLIDIQLPIPMSIHVVLDSPVRGGGPPSRTFVVAYSKNPQEIYEPGTYTILTDSLKVRTNINWFEAGSTNDWIYLLTAPEAVFSAQAGLANSPLIMP